MDIAGQIPLSCQQFSHTVNSGFGYQPAYISPIFCDDSSQLSDSGICISNSSRIDVLSDGVPTSPPGHSSPPSLSSPPGLSSRQCEPQLQDLRRPLSNLSENSNIALTQPVLPVRFQSGISIVDKQQPSAPYVVPSLSNLSLKDGLDAKPSIVDTRPSSILPDWVVDSQGHVITSLRKILEEDLLESFAKDKNGCTFLQANYPGERTEERELLTKNLFEREKLFESLCMDVFGNFFIQCAIQNATAQEHRWITSHLFGKIYAMCMNRYSCRVIQKAIECLPDDMKSVLMLELHHRDLVALCTDQNANHVIQKLMTSFPLPHWQFVVDQFVRNEDALFCVAENKYGCRVVQLAIELLSDCNKKMSKRSLPLLENLITHLISNCERLACNEFANYIIQHVIKAGLLSDYRDRLIENCLLRNLLSWSQEKYASHVVEKALEFAPPKLLAEMMDEIFDGYLPHPDTKKDALDIMLFHQYGNYVIQRMLDICCEAVRAKRNGINLPDMELRMTWLSRLELRISNNRHRLARYSSGKKILATLQQLNECSAPPTTARVVHRSRHQTSVPSQYR